jgi:hypothetical protein
MRRIIVVIFVTLAVAPQAHAQNMIYMPNGGGNGAGTRGQTVSVNFQISRAAPVAASTSDLTSIMASITQSLYDIVNRECDILGVSLKGSCRVLQVNVGANINNRGNGHGPIVTANANATFAITSPVAAAPAASSAH